MRHDYTSPVARLLTHSALDFDMRNDAWADYLALELTAEHVPELVRMASDLELHRADADSREVWAPVHAWRALGQLRAEAAVPDLIRLFERLTDDDWVSAEMPQVFSLIGPASVPALAAFLGDDTVDEQFRLDAPQCLSRIGLDHPEARETCVGVLTAQLEKHGSHGPDLNGLLIWCLLDLGAVESIDVMRAAFAADDVDWSIVGDLEEVEISLGLRTHRTTPKPRFAPVLSGIDALIEDGDGIWVPPGHFDDYGYRAPVRRGTKTGRNEPCPCGSGRKYKKCCLAVEDVLV